MAVGDLMLGWAIGRRIVQQRPGRRHGRTSTQYFDQADLVVANLECAISASRHAMAHEAHPLRARRWRAADSLAAGGVDVVTRRQQPRHSTSAATRSATPSRPSTVAGVGHVGGGTDAAAAHAPPIVERNGLRIAFLGYVLPFCGARTTFNTREWEATSTRAGLAHRDAGRQSRRTSLARAARSTSWS